MISLKINIDNISKWTYINLVTLIDNNYHYH